MRIYEKEKKDFQSLSKKCMKWLLFCAVLWALREIYPDCPFLIISSVLVYLSIPFVMFLCLAKFIRAIMGDE